MRHLRSMHESVNSSDNRNTRSTAPSMAPWEPALASANYVNWLARVWEIWWTRSGGSADVDAVRRRRFNALVQYARTHSPLYRECYRNLPSRDLDPSELPVV